MWYFERFSGHLQLNLFIMTTTIVPQLQATQQAAAQVRRLTSEQKTALLNRLADLLLEHQALIMAENQKDMERMPDGDRKKTVCF